MPPVAARIRLGRSWMPASSGTAVAAALVLAAGLSLAGPARADVPTADANDSPDTAQGPLAGGVTYTGATDSDEDDDWFTFSVGAGTHQVVIAVSQPARGTCTLPDDGAFVELYGPSADDSPPLAQISGAGTGTPQQITSTLTGPSTYFLDVGTDCAPGAPWALRLDAPGAPAAPPGQEQGRAPGATTTAPSTAPATALSPAHRAALCRQAKRSRTRWTAGVAATRRDLHRARAPVTRRLARRLLALQRSTLRRVDGRVKAYC
jgi:hypothetical protein